MDESIVKSEYDGLMLSVAQRRVEHPRAAIQIVYGMAEHKERYYELMGVLRRARNFVARSRSQGPRRERPE